MALPVNVSAEPPLVPITKRTSFTAGGQAEYWGWANSIQPESVITVTTVSKDTAAAVTATAHGMASNQKVRIAGASGDWAALNGDQIITVTDANTFTVPVDSSGFSGDFDGVIVTTAPRSTYPCWSIQKWYYDANNNLELMSGVFAARAWGSRDTYFYQ